jgi:hypothetical protein
MDMAQQVSINEMSGQVITNSKCIVHCSTLKVTSYINLLAEPYPLFELVRSCFNEQKV